MKVPGWWRWKNVQCIPSDFQLEKYVNVSQFKSDMTYLNLVISLNDNLILKRRLVFFSFNACLIDYWIMFVNILWNTVNTVIIIIKICLCHFLIFKILFQCENNRKLTTFNERKKINTRHRVMLFLSAMIAAKEYTSISVLHRKSKSFHTMWNYSDYGKFSRGTCRHTEKCFSLVVYMR